MKLFKVVGYLILIGVVVMIGMLINYAANLLGIDLWPGEGFNWGPG